MRPGPVGVATARLTLALLVIAGCRGDEHTDGTTAVAAGSSSTPIPTTSPASTTTSVPTSTDAASTSSAPIPTDAASTSSAPIPTIATTSSTTTTPDVTDCVEGMSVAEMAALVTWPAVVTDDWATARQVVGELGVGGVLLMEPGDDVSEAGLAGLLNELDELSEHGILVATDEEGGTVQRLRRYRELPSQREVAETMSAAEAAELITEHGEFVRRVGVDVVLGPVVDVAPSDGDPALAASRFFSPLPDEVTAYAAAYVAGWSASGLLPTLKHFPGHGSASADTHDALGITPPLADLEAADLVPYRSLAPGATDHPPIAVMVGHLDAPGLTDAEPASLSSQAIEFLRDDVGFDDALVVSDALEMGAVEPALPDAAVESIAAGVDVVLFTRTDATGAVIDAVVAAVGAGELSEDRLADAADRVLRSDRTRDCGPGDP